MLKHRTQFILLCGFIILFNFLTLSFWIKPKHRNVPISWWPPVYSEIFQPPKNVWDIIIEIVKNEIPPNTDPNETIAALPKWVREIPIFYLGDQYLIRPPIKKGSMAEMELRQFIGDKAFSRFERQPKWIFDIFSKIKRPLPGYKLLLIPSHRARPDDGTRPELTRHTFPQKEITGYARIYQLER